MSASPHSWIRPADLRPESPFGTKAPPFPSGEAERVWRELALGHWVVLSATDFAARRYAALARVESPTALDWRRLTDREQAVLSRAASGTPQKVIAIELGLPRSTVSKTLRSARECSGFASSAPMLRAWRAAAASTRLSSSRPHQDELL